ncbi:MAG: hypothetical protein LWW97_04865 [Deltaproteobacteria bacterium]|nr:hypothetical protein [Deltaproteobacteria bacterium]
MSDDLISAMTQEVKEEVINNYLYERRLIEEQITYVKELADHAAQLQEMLFKRFARMYDLLLKPEFINEFVFLLGLKEIPFNDRIADDLEYHKDVLFIKVRGLTDRSKFKKLLLEAYIRLCNWNNKYLEAYRNLIEECKAVNHNLKKFEDNHDLLTILNFLKGMDHEAITKKHFMGDNFAPEEIASIEQTMRFKPVSIKQFNLIPAPSLPELTDVRNQIASLANSVYDQCSNNIKTLIR